MILPRSSFGLVYCSDKLFVVGGYKENQKVVADCEVYLMSSDNWLPL